MRSFGDISQYFLRRNISWFFTVKLLYPSHSPSFLHIYLLTSSPHLLLAHSPPFPCYRPSFPPFNQTNILAHTLSNSLPRQQRAVGDGKQRRNGEKQTGDKWRWREGWGRAGTETSNLLHNRYMIIFTQLGCIWSIWKGAHRPVYGNSMDWFHCLAQMCLWEHGNHEVAWYSGQKYYF